MINFDKLITLARLRYSLAKNKMQPLTKELELNIAEPVINGIVCSILVYFFDVNAVFFLLFLGGIEYFTNKAKYPQYPSEASVLDFISNFSIALVFVLLCYMVACVIK